MCLSECLSRHMVYKGSEDSENADIEDLSSALLRPLQQSSSKNPFNFSQRQTQTPLKIERDRSTNTEPPPQQSFGGVVSQWSIYDAYTDDLAMKERQKEKNKASANTGGANSGGGSKKDESHGSLNNAGFPGQQVSSSESGGGQGQHGGEDFKSNPDVKSIVTHLERMCDQNSHDDIIMDYKYWEDQADAFRENKGVLLPLWKFHFEKEKKRQVTALAWHPEFKDFFAVGFGSYEFLKAGGGAVACYTLKNSSHPDIVFKSDSGVMCLQFQPDNPNWIAVGFYDGSVAIYDLLVKSADMPIYKSTAKSGKHHDPVWEIKWQKKDMDDNLNFLTTSTDGRVTQWTVTKTELVAADVIHLRADKSDPSHHAVAVVGKEDTVGPLIAISGGTCFDINHFDSDIFIVGTEDGRLVKCSKAYNSQYVMTYEAHKLGVYAVKYSTHCRNVFLSASADWTVKLWDDTIQQPILMFDLGQSVGDIAWSPVSSTVFAAVASDGRVVVYDISVSKFEPICDQAITKNSKLTHLSFNKFRPSLIVGDDIGQVLSFKLSPNLRKINPNDAQDERLTQILDVIMGKSVAAAAGK